MKAADISKKELQRVMDVMSLAKDANYPQKLSSLVSAVNGLVPHEYRGCGIFSLSQRDTLTIGFSSYHHEFTRLYAGKGFLTDPSIQLIVSSKATVTASNDCPHLCVPKQVTDIKQDFGIHTCLSFSIRGVKGLCSYFAFSNYDIKEEAKLRMMMDMVVPHLHLAYMRCLPGQSENALPQVQHLSKREEEIMKWMSEGKTNWEISKILNISLRTVKFHCSNIYKKLGGVPNRYSAVANWQWSASGLLTSISCLSSVHSSKPAPTSNRPRRVGNHGHGVKPSIKC